VVFAAAGGRVVLLGVSRQLIGDEAFGASGYTYCGSILSAADDPQFDDEEGLVQAASALARTVVEEFGLVGVNGIDFVARGAVPNAIEVNPRWCASMELVERAYGLSVFGVHAKACASGLLPNFDFMTAVRRSGSIGKAVVFARDDTLVGDTRMWLEDTNTRDVPAPGQRVGAGEPICTVFASASCSEACYSALVNRARRIYAEVRAGRNVPEP
jgi:predicted ATP-grasp superfamily ATP-dependent carboligase